MCTINLELFQIFFPNSRLISGVGLFHFFSQNIGLFLAFSAYYNHHIIFTFSSKSRLRQEKLKKMPLFITLVVFTFWRFFYPFDVIKKSNVAAVVNLLTSLYRLLELTAFQHQLSTNVISKGTKCNLKCQISFRILKWKGVWFLQKL